MCAFKSFHGGAFPRYNNKPYFKPKTDWKNNNWNDPPKPFNVKTALKFLGMFCLIFFGLWILKQIFRQAMNKPAILDQFFKQPVQPEKVKGESKGETLCRSLANKIFGKPFDKIRPDFLKNNVTGANLELDIFNEEIKVAIEYNGEQHYKYIPFFHKNYEHFMNQKYRDEIKRMLCIQNGIYLIEIPFDMQPIDIETKIRMEALKLGLYKDIPCSFEQQQQLAEAPVPQRISPFVSIIPQPSSGVTLMMPASIQPQPQPVEEPKKPKRQRSNKKKKNQEILDIMNE